MGRFATAFYDNYLVSLFSPSMFVLFGLMLLFGWMGLVGLVRAEFLKARNFDYVRSARAMGVSDGKDYFSAYFTKCIGE